MALVVKDRVKVTTTTTGTGTLTLGSAVTKFQDFSVIGDGNTTYYSIESGNGTDWEIGVGTYTASGTTLSRDTILESSNAGSAINLSGTSIVFCTYPAERSVNTADIGSTIQGYDADTAKYDDTTANFVGTLQNGGSNVVVDNDIGSTVQAYDADTAKYDDTTANFTGNLQKSGANVLTANQTITLSGDVTGSGATSITTTVGNDSHSHTTSTLSGNVSAFTNDSGYITGNQTITLSGDATGSGTTSITVTVVDDSHNHIISNVDGLQTALDGKQPIDADLTAIAGLANTDGNFIVGNGTTWVAESGATARTSLGLGSLATLSTVDAATITDNSVGAAELNVSGNGTTSQYLRSDGDGTFTWATPPSITTTTGSPDYYAARAWVNFNGTGTVAIREDVNVSSITDLGQGEYQVNFTTAMPDTNFCTLGSSIGTNSSGDGILVGGFGSGTITATTYIKVRTSYGPNNIAYDMNVMNVAVFR